MPDKMMLDEQQQPEEKHLPRHGTRFSYSRPENLVEDLEKAKEDVHHRLPTSIGEEQTVGRASRRCRLEGFVQRASHENTVLSWLAGGETHGTCLR